MKTNILVQYQGGGYDGCFWEWNYFYIDTDGTFHDIQSSGRAGIDNLQAGQELIDRNESHTYIYDMSSEQDIITFNKECNPVHITGVLQWFEDYNSPDVEFFAVCSECGNHIGIDDAMLENWHGCGGIVSTADTLLCYECHSLGVCDCCDAYVGADNIIEVNPDEHHGHDYICTGCKEQNDEQREQDRIEDLRWQSFCTGKPDMFSGELRERRLESGGGI